MDKEDAGKIYLNFAETYYLQAGKEEKRLLLLSLFRFLTFFGGIVLVWAGFHFAVYAGIAAFSAVALTFLFLLKSYSFHTSRKEYYNNLTTINKNEYKALYGDISMFGDGSSFSDTSHDFSYDIDLFGPSSLFQYLNRTSTGYGSEVLARWLEDPYPLTCLLRERQNTVREMAGKLEWRQKFLAHGMNGRLERSHISGLVSWLNRRPPADKVIYKKSFLRIFPSLTIITLILSISGFLGYYFFVSFFLLDLFITFYHLKKTSAVHEELSGRYGFLSSFGNLLLLLDNESFESKEINRMKDSIGIEGSSAVGALKELGNIIMAFDSRLNILAGFLLNGLLLWDLQCIHRLESWKMNYSPHFPGWLEMLGKTDAFITLGNYAYNNPEYIYPGLSEKDKLFYASQLGHQLIDKGKRICNDFEITGRGKICIITGANMAGKSTFLRTVAINYILAMTGAPVCAREMSFSPVRLFTSMRTTDSLASNESYFYAELKRLRILKRKISAEEDLFFILDEILKGTNSEDKSQGSRLFIDMVIKLGGMGMIATHDTSLGDLGKEYPDKIINKCIEVEIDGEKIIFDYKLRDGVASKKNAVILMRQMGILG